MANKKPDFNLPISGVIVLALGIVAYFFSQKPLEPSRPAGTGVDTEAVSGLTRARLWQDPLDAVQGQAKQKPQGKEALVAVLKKPPSDTGKILILLAMMESSPYPEGSEQRIRERFAIQSALGVACFVPEDGEHLRYFTQDDGVVVPYEWFRPRRLRSCQGEAYAKVLLLWLRDDAFEHPLEGLRQFAATLMRDVTEPPGQSVADRLEVKLLGPPSSAMFRDMVAETLTAKERLTWPNHNKTVELYSPWASVSSEAILVSLGQKVKGPDEPRVYLKKMLMEKAGVDLAYRIGSGYDLAVELLKELERRGVRIRDEPDPIALISEWDTYYGRTLPQELTVAACIEASRCEKTTHVEVLEELAPQASLYGKVDWIRRYSYLRGLDGELPGGGSNQEKGKDSKKQAELRALERPEGKSQLDYVRRLVERLDTDANLLVKSGKEFKAIGVLGSDVYDTLLILQALRPYFPKTIFFTADLDARLLYATDFEWTRNLVILSDFGLQLHPDLQRGVPPFRDSYQTSVFFSVLRALGYLCPAENGHGCMGGDASFYRIGDQAGRYAATGPRIFEVGRSGAVDVSVSFPPIADKALHPPRPDRTAELGMHGGFIAQRTVLLVLTAFLILSVFVPVCRVLWLPAIDRVRNYPASGAVAGIWRIGMWGVSILAIGLLVGAYWDGYEGEPMTLHEGVSVWPTSVLRIIGTFGAWLFLWWAAWLVEHSLDSLGGEFALPGRQSKPSVALPLPGCWWARMKALYVFPDRYLTDGVIEGAWIDAEKLWQRYCFLSKTSLRLVRVCLWIVVFWAITLGMFSLSGFPGQPSRGPATFWAHKAVMLVGTTFLLALLFFVLDATLLGTRFIDALTDHPTKWPDQVLTEQVEARGIDRDLLPDWLDIQFIGKHTGEVGRLIYFPFIILFVMLVARSRYFDNWDFHAGLLVLYLLSAAIAIVCAVVLRKAGERARKEAIRGLLSKLTQEEAKGEKDGPRPKHIRQMIEEIQETHQGAFADFLDQPWVRAALVVLLALAQQYFVG